MVPQCVPKTEKHAIMHRDISGGRTQRRRSVSVTISVILGAIMFYMLVRNDAAYDQ